MKLPAIGRVENVDDLDLEPIEVPVIGYTLDKEEVEETFRFRPSQPAGAAMDLMGATGPDGNVPIQMVMRYLDASVLEGDRDLWRDFLHREDVFIEQTALVALYMAIVKIYSQRPTPRWSDSDGGGSANGTTSPAVARSTGSAASKKRTSPKR